MNFLSLIIPTSFLVAASQIIIKWRTNQLISLTSSDNYPDKIYIYFTDFYIVLAYFLALIGSVIWILAIPRTPLTIGFPIYIGLTFFMVIIGSIFILSESLSMLKLCAIILIFSGILLGSID